MVAAIRQDVTYTLSYRETRITTHIAVPVLSSSLASLHIFGSWKVLVVPGLSMATEEVRTESLRAQDRTHNLLLLGDHSLTHQFIKIDVKGDYWMDQQCMADGSDQSSENKQGFSLRSR